MENRPYLFIVDGHKNASKDKFIDFLIDKLHIYDMQIRDMRSYIKGGIPNPKNNKRKYEKRMINIYNKISKDLIKYPKFSIIKNWIRSERINSYFEKRKNLEEFLNHDEIKKKYRIINFTLLFYDYENYKDKLFYDYDIKKPPLSVIDFEDITCHYIERYLNDDEQLENEYEFVIDIYDNNKQNFVQFEELWNMLYPIIYDETPEIAPSLSGIIEGNQTNS